MSRFVKEIDQPNRGENPTCTRTSFEFCLHLNSFSQQHIRYCEQQNYIDFHITDEKGYFNWNPKHVGLWQTPLHPLSREMLTLLKYIILKRRIQKRQSRQRLLSGLKNNHKRSLYLTFVYYTVSLEKVAFYVIFSTMTTSCDENKVRLQPTKDIWLSTLSSKWGLLTLLAM